MGSDNWELLEQARIASDSFVRSYRSRWIPALDPRAVDQAFEDVLLAGGTRQRTVECGVALEVLAATIGRSLPVPEVRLSFSAMKEVSLTLADLKLRFDLAELTDGKAPWKPMDGLERPRIGMLDCDLVQDVATRALALDLDALDDETYEFVESLQSWNGIQPNECLVSFFY